MVVLSVVAMNIDYSYPLNDKQTVQLYCTVYIYFLTACTAIYNMKL